MIRLKDSLVDICFFSHFIQNKRKLGELNQQIFILDLIMATEGPFHTDNNGLGDFESEQLYLEVNISFDLSSFDEYFLGCKYSSKTSNGSSTR